MSEGAIAERYARAIFELGEESGQLEAVARHIQLFTDTYEASADLRSALNDPGLPEPTRANLLRSMTTRLGIAKDAGNALQVILQRRRLPWLTAITRRLMSLADERGGVLRVSVTSAKPLPEGYFQKLTREIEGATQRKVVLERAVDERLIAGVRTQVGGYTIDGSIQGRLRDFERRLLSNP